MPFLIGRFWRKRKFVMDKLYWCHEMKLQVARRTGFAAT